MSERILNPQTTTIVREPGSVRRTQHVDIIAGEDFSVKISGGARDLITLGDGTAKILGTATMSMETDTERHLTSISCNPGQAVANQLLGKVVGPGFRAAISEAMSTVNDGSFTTTDPTFVLLDELPVAALISGYVLLYTDTLKPNRSEGAGLKADICAGWTTEGTMITVARKTGKVPVPECPPAPPLDSGGDSFAWHDMPDLALGAMRRRRLLDVKGSRVFAMFRDTFIKPETGEETVLHEYSLRAQYDGKFLSCEATPQVLPWVECPNAAASASRLVGVTASEVRNFVRQYVNGTSSCTHLNDLLRSLGDVEVLARKLD